MRGIICRLHDFDVFASDLEEGREDLTLPIPEGGDRPADGEWVLASFLVGEDEVAVAACATDRGNGLRLAFMERDWQKLSRFVAERRGRPSDDGGGCAVLPSGSLRAAPGTRVLIVDGDADMQAMLTHLLQACGFQVETACCCDEALGSLREGAIDLLVLDWHVHGAVSEDLCRTIRSDMSFGRVPVLFITSSVCRSELDQAMAAGADDFVTMPFRLPELGARILGLLGPRAAVGAA